MRADNAPSPGAVSHVRRLWLYAVAGLVLFFLVLPVFIVVPMSFSSSRYLDFPPPAWSLRWYAAYLGSTDWTLATLVSLKVAGLTCVIATPLGVAAAYAIHSSELAFMKTLQTLLLLPLMVPGMVVAVGVYFLYARVNLVGTTSGLVLAHVMHAIPFVVVTTLSGLQQFDDALERAARSLGCNRLQAFWRVTLPQIAGSVGAGALFAFVTSLDEIIIALFISSGANTTLTKIMFTTLRDEIDPRIAAVSSLLIFTSVAVALLTALRRGDRPGS